MELKNTSKMQIKGILEKENGEYVIIGDAKESDDGLVMNEFKLSKVIEDYDELDVRVTVATDDEFLKLKQTQRASIRGILMVDKECVEVEMKEDVANVSFDEIFEDFIGAFVDIGLTHHSEIK